ncbi:iron-regulated ABC transporter permease protein SufD [Homoserinimonas aerilata]|uniref:Iron-regulated ABC transporter permease protein SufD n=1 Tax=Homoserinimonas aerilata TaxID=1162970 RepID=A0A542YIX5_9MICO|nr:Fe-S cluster assembly protein SufD [Homoserinimonas aerilata]TQL48037.1 iron-regulated ABC transporter permease protein SufD [Homoserinimonas aerilata]
MATSVASAHTPTANPSINHSRLGSKQHSVGGLGIAPIQTRSERFSSYDVADFQPVQATDSEWKYTPLGAVRPLTGDSLNGSPVEPEVSTTGSARFEWIERTDAHIGTAGIPEDRASANAWSSFERAAHIVLDGQDGRVTVIRSAMGSEPRAAHTVITATAGSRGVVVLDNRGKAMLAENLEIVVEDEAAITVVSLQEWDDDAVHLASHFATVGRRAKLRYVSATLGGLVARINPSVRLAGERGDAEVYGLYFADAGQHIEHQVFVNHDAPNTVSHVTYKGALQGEGAHTAWIGDVLIGRNGTGTDSYEQNRNLLLTEGARADSVPNLEIETGDIKGAGHASASGRFDDEQLFYLQARGIREDEARRLVVRGFLGEVVQKIGVPEIEAHLHEAIEAELAATR